MNASVPDGIYRDERRVWLVRGEKRYYVVLRGETDEGDYYKEYVQFVLLPGRSDLENHWQDFGRICWLELALLGKGGVG